MLGMRGLAGVLTAVTLAATTGCGRIEVGAFSNLDPDRENLLIIGLDKFGLEPIEIPLIGGVEGRVIADTRRLLSPEGIVAFIEGDAVRIAGDSPEFPGLCITEDPEDPVEGVGFVRFKRESKADLHFAGIATSELIEFLQPGGFLVAMDLEDVPLEIDWFELLDFDLDGTVRASVTETLEVPPDVPLLAGAPITLVLNLESSSRPATDPLVDECASASAH